MGALDNVYSLVQRVRSMQGHQIHSLTHGERLLIRSLRDMGLM